MEPKVFYKVSKGINISGKKSQQLASFLDVDAAIDFIHSHTDDQRNSSGFKNGDLYLALVRQEGCVATNYGFWKLKKITNDNSKS